jgi:hypothetical protein
MVGIDLSSPFSDEPLGSAAGESSSSKAWDDLAAELTAA